MPFSLRTLRGSARLEWLTLRWWQRAIMWLFWPLMFVGTLYMGLFFFLNSSPFARIVEAQLDAAMMGDWAVGDVSVDLTLTTLRIDAVQLYTPEGEQVIDAEGVVAPIPWSSLWDLVDQTHLDLRDIELRRADVLLDFTEDGPFNLLRALAPSKPSEEGGGDFTLALHDIDLGSSHVLLRFDGFEIDLDDVQVDDYTLRVGHQLEMQSAPHPAGLAGVRVGAGVIRFEPRMFGFPQGRDGSPEHGVGGDGGAGRLGHVAGMTQLASTALHNSCARLARRSGAGALCGELGERPVRGDLEVHFADARIRNFWWRASTFGMTGFVTTLLEPDDTSGELEPIGEISLSQPWMNVSPTADEIEEASDVYGHALPETRPEDTILYYATGNVTLPANSRALAWFFGPLIANDDPIHLVAEVSGDLHNAEGLVSARTDRLDVAGVRVDDLVLSGTLEGQRFDLVDLSASTLTGRVMASGHYLILDGDFDLDLELGAIDAENLERTDGVDASLVAPPSAQRFLGGELVGALNVAQTAGRLALTLREPLRLELAEPLPYSGATQVVLTQSLAGGADPADGDDTEVGDTRDDYAPPPPLLTMENRVLRLHDALRLEVGEDALVVEADARLWLDTLEVADLVVRLDVGDAGQYLRELGLDVHTSRLIVTARASGPLLSPRLSTTLAVRGGRAYGIEVPRLDLVARYERGRIDARRLAAQTSLGSIDASGWILAFDGSLTRLRSEMPLSFEADARGLRLESLPWLAPYGLRGAVELEDVQVRGTTKRPRFQGRVSARELAAGDHLVPRLETRVGFDGDSLEVTDLSASYQDASDATVRASLELDKGRYRLGDEAIDLEGLEAIYGPREREGDTAGPTRLSLASAHYGLQSGRFAFDRLDLSALRLEELAPLRDAAPTLRARVDLRGSGAGDVDALLGRSSSVDTTLQATLAVHDATWAERRIGSLALDIATPEPNVVALAGSLSMENAREPLELEARAELHTRDARARLTFSSLELLDLVPELAIALNGDANVHRSRFRDRPPRVQALSISGAVEVAWSSAEGLVADVALSQVASIVLGQILVSRGDVLLHYAHGPQRLEVRRMEIENHEKSLMIYGSAGLDGTVDVEVTGELNAQLARMAGEVIPEARGSLAIAVHAVGDVLDPRGAFTLADLDVTGFVAVREAIMMRIRGLGDPVEVERGVLHIAESSDCPRSGEPCYLIPVDQAFAGSVLGGTFELSGEIGRRDVFLPVSAELLATGEELAFRIKDTLTVTFDVPELRLFVLDLTDLELVPPQLYGAVEITEGRYYKDHLVQSEIFQQSIGSLSKSDRREERFETPIWQRFPELAAVEIDITVDSESGFRIDNEVAGARVDLELEFNNLHLGGTLQNLEPSGVVNIRDGEVVFRSNRFEVLPGAQLRFNESLDAVVDVAAQAEISTQSSFASTITGGTTRDRRDVSTSDLARGSELYIVTLTVTGALSELAWTLESNPFLATNNIVYLVLTGQTIEDSAAASEGNPIGSVALEQLIAPLFESQVDEIISAEQLKFQFAEGAAQFSYIQQINRALRVAAGVSIRGAEGNESAIAGEYRFDDRLLLELILQDAVEEEGKAPQFSIGGRLEWRIPLD